MREGGLHFHFYLWLVFLFALTVASFGLGVKNQSVRCIAPERQALLDFKIGVGCDNSIGNVVKLDLDRIFITGEIGSSLLELKQLSYLDLSFNHFHKIPNFIGSLSDLTYLDLSDNFSTGFIPHQFGNLSRLLYLDLSYNYLWGSIPLSFDNMPALQCINFEGNNLEGGIPKSLGKICNLKELNLKDNELSESLLVVVKNLSGCAKDSLQALILARNQLTGALPNLSILSSFQRINLRGNNLEGGTPKSLGNICNLKELDLTNNKLSGSLGVVVKNLSVCAKNSLQALLLARNRLTGALHDLSILFH
ncbi:LRR receptor-like serine/threonine-protein kinase ERECTA [Gossypium australe]|uniref:LRR receptor-like serine/threonine-protein kinase ERECTA n=1 Tax=Gossypium australe TaxID=47621 RepID=A0A5B6VHU6_9ROSI|nr:LRR receptor-like serine/threonine-protein kinase ERECTA [Gossypium australe]